MVSLKQRQDLAKMAEADPQLKRFQLLLDGGKPTDHNPVGEGVREELLAAISTNNSVRFNEVAFKIGERRISAESDWCQDDYLLFLLILGNQKFGRSVSFLGKVIEARRQNSNPIPQKINEVFAALEREEFGIDGEFGFLKIPFLYLLGKLRLGPTEARRAIQAFSKPGLLDQISPFLQLLTQKAYDLVLLERQPLATETTKQLIEGFEAHAKDLSFRHWWRVVVALPGRVIWALVACVIALGLIPFLFGAGKTIVQLTWPQEIRVRPSSIRVTAVHEATQELPSEALIIAKAFQETANAAGKRSLILTVEGEPFASATPAFVVEVSHPDKAILNAIAFTQSVSKEPHSLTVIPVQRDGGRFRALLPEMPADQRLYFMLEVAPEGNESANTIGQRVVFRCLQ